MKNTIKSVMFCAALLAGGFCFNNIVFAEQVNDFQATITVNADSSLNIKENIVYDFGGLQKHGIYRYIPVRYTRDNFSYNLRVSDVSVIDDNGNSYKFQQSYSGDNLNVKIGDADTTITGIHDYIIQYKIEKAINYFDDHDELYWNVNGFGWEVPIAKIGAVVIIPAELNSGNNFDFKCFTGSYGSTMSCENAAFVNKNGNTYVGFSSSNLSSGQNLSVLLKFPKGTVIALTQEQIVKNILLDNWVLVLPIIIFSVLLYIWVRFGRGPKGRGIIIAEYDIPDNLTPIEVGTIIDQRTDNWDISAEMVYLAINGYLKITKIEKKWVFGSSDYKLNKLKGKEDLKNQFDKDLMDYLFESGDEVSLSEIANRNKRFDFSGKTIADVTTDTSKSLEEKQYFDKNYWKPIVMLIGVGELLFIVAIIIYFKYAIPSLWPILAILLAQVVIIIFPFLVSRMTQKGVYTKEHIQGLKLYLSVAEKERIKFHNAPEKNPQTFEKFLPYAMVLGVEKEWAKQFEGIYTQPTSGWYSSSTMPIFSASLLINDMNSFNTATQTSFGSVAAGGGSGFAGGGGFSGGGFGGGGGGSW